jgi:uncharacterized protein YbjT (DUF2867 family)
MIKQIFILMISVLVIAQAAIADPINKDDTVLVIGATGRTGSLIVKQLQQRNIKVLAGVRDLEKGKNILGENTPLIKLDVSDLDSLLLATKKADAVISAASANSRTGGEALKKKIEFQGNANIAEAVKTNGLKKFVLISAMGVTNKNHILNRVANNVMLWKFEGEKAIRASGIDYTIVRPGGLKDGLGGEQAFKIMQGDSSKDVEFIDRNDVATLCVEALLSGNASRKTFEVVAIEGEPMTNFDAAFKQLHGD